MELPDLNHVNWLELDRCSDGVPHQPTAYFELASMAIYHRVESRLRAEMQEQSDF